MKSIFDMIFHLKAAQNFIAEHEERDFELIFQFKTAQNVVRRHYERYFDTHDSSIEVGDSSKLGWIAT